MTLQDRLRDVGTSWEVHLQKIPRTEAGGVELDADEVGETAVLEREAADRLDALEAQLVAARAQIVELKELGRRTLLILEALVALAGGPR